MAFFRRATVALIGVSAGAGATWLYVENKRKKLVSPNQGQENLALIKSLSATGATRTPSPRYILDI